LVSFSSGLSQKERKKRLKQVNNIKGLFRDLDVNDRGSLSRAELQKGLEIMGMQMDDIDVAEPVSQIDDEMLAQEGYDQEVNDLLLGWLMVPMFIALGAKLLWPPSKREQAQKLLMSMAKSDPDKKKTSKKAKLLQAAKRTAEEEVEAIGATWRWRSWRATATRWTAAATRARATTASHKRTRRTTTPLRR